jgi:hypothetical protein
MSNRRSAPKRLSELHLVRKVLLLRVPSLPNLLETFRLPAGLPGVSSLFATSPLRVHLPRAHPKRSLRSALGLSQPLDGLLRGAARGFVPPHCHVQGCLPFRGFSPRAAFPPSSGRVAPVSFSASELTGRNRCPLERASTSRPCSARGRVVSGLVLPAPQLAPLLGFLSPPGVSLRRARSYLRGSTPDVAPADLRLRAGPLRPSSASRRRRP